MPRRGDVAIAAMKMRGCPRDSVVDHGGPATSKKHLGHDYDDEENATAFNLNKLEPAVLGAVRAIADYLYVRVWRGDTEEPIHHHFILPRLLMLLLLLRLLMLLRLFQPR